MLIRDSERLLNFSQGKKMNLCTEQNLILEFKNIDIKRLILIIYNTLRSTQI